MPRVASMANESGASAALACCTWDARLGNSSGGVILSGEDVTAGPLDLRKRFGSSALLLRNRFKWKKQHRKSLSNHFLFLREVLQCKEHKHQKFPTLEATPELKRGQAQIGFTWILNALTLKRSIANFLLQLFC